MKRKKLLSILATLTVCGAAVVTYPKESFAIYLGDFNGENLGQKLIDEGKKSYVDGVFQGEVKKQKHEMISNKAGTEYSFTFDVPTWTAVTAGRGGWIERLAGNGPSITGPGTGVPGYDKIYYGEGPNYNGNFEVIDLAATTPDSTMADITVTSAINKTTHKISVTTKIVLKKDANVATLPLNYTANGIKMGTQVVDSTNSSQYNVPLVVQEIDLGNSKTKATLNLGTVNVGVGTGTAGSSSSSSTTSTTSTSSSSSTTSTTSTSSSSSTTSTTSTSSSSSTTPSTSTSSSSSTMPSTSTSSSTMPSMSSSSSVNSTTSTSSKAKMPVYPSSSSTSSSSNATRNVRSASASTLPKTGEKESIWITLTGILLLGASMFYLKKNKVKNK